MAYHVSQSTMNRQRMKAVSLWSLQRTASAVLSALRTITDPMSAQLKDAYANEHMQTVLQEAMALNPGP